MSDILENKVAIGAKVETKNAFDVAAKSATEFFRANDQSWKNATARVTDYTNAAGKFAKAVSGPGENEIVGAFGMATRAAAGFTGGFILGGITAATSELTSLVMKGVSAFADMEDAENRLLATGKVTQDQLKGLEHEWRELAPTVGRHVTDLAGDYATLLGEAPKMAPFFAGLQQYMAVTGSSFRASLDMANTALIGGVKPAEMLAYLENAARANLTLGDKGTSAAAAVSRSYRTLGITGATTQTQINNIIIGLKPVLGSATAAGDAMIKVIEQAAAGKGDSKMQRMVNGLREGKLTLTQFFDEMMARTDPLGKQFQLILQNDPITRDFIKAWEQGAAAIHELNTTKATAFKDHPMLTDSTRTALNRLTEALLALSEAIGGLLPASKTLEFIAHQIERITAGTEKAGAAIEEMEKYGITQERWKDTGALGSPLTPFSRWLFPHSPKAAREPYGPQLPGAGGKPAFFSGGGGGDMEPGSDDGLIGAISALDINDPATAGNVASTVADAMRTYFAASGEPGLGGAAGAVSAAGGAGGGLGDIVLSQMLGGASSGFSGTGGIGGMGGDGLSTMKTMQSINDAEVHSMAMPGPGRRGAAFTPGAGELPWPMLAGVPASQWGRGFNVGPAGGAPNPAGNGDPQGTPRPPSPAPTGPGPEARPPSALVEGPKPSFRPPLPPPRPPMPPPVPLPRSRPIKVAMEVEPPPRWQLQRAARYTSQLGDLDAERDQQARGAGQIGFA
jgi:hypothetical protein